MEDFLKDDTFLARWAAGELSPEELEMFRQHPHFDQYEKLLKESRGLTVPVFNKEQLYESISNQKESQSNVKRMVPIKALLGIAATLMLLFSAYLFFPGNEVITKTGAGEIATISLPDGSSLILNSNSVASYHSRDYKKNRSVDLSGEAFFDVEKGEGFSVLTQNGKVEVLGTSFNVISRDKRMEVACKTGKVRVSSNTNNAVVLEPGQRVRIENDALSAVDSIPVSSISSWKEGFSRFERAPLIDVILAIENQFGVKIEIDKAKTTDQTFTGGFQHDNLEVALQAVIIPMDLTYEMKNERTVEVK